MAPPPGPTAAEGIACDYAKGGTVVLARTPVQLERAREEVEESRGFGFGEGDLRLLSVGEARAHANATHVLGGTFTPHCAAIHPARLVRETYPFRVDVRARFGDLDTNRHVNNVALAGWYVDALAELHLDVLGYPTGGPLDSLAPSSLRIDYLAEVQYPAIHQLRVGVVALDETSVRYACGLFDGPRCIGLAEATGGLSPDEDSELGPRLSAFALRR